jgi:peptidoglycan/xylan/chitin deacetylase (PgdA/CDA1 family)
MSHNLVVYKSSGHKRKYKTKTQKLFARGFWTVLLLVLSLATVIYFVQQSRTIVSKNISSSSNIPEVLSTIIANSSQPLNLNNSSSSTSSSIASSLPTSDQWYKGIAKVPVIMYHHIAGWAGITSGVERGLRVSPGILEKHLQYIKAQGYTTITGHQLSEYQVSKKPLPDKPILLTFDDGYLDNYVSALPLLTKYNMKGDFAIIAATPGSSKIYMTWNQIRELRDLGHGISSHSYLHCYLTQRTTVDGKKIYSANPVGEDYKPCPDLNWGGQINTLQVKFEVDESKKIIEKEMAKKIETFIYPFGNYNPQIVAAVKSAGYTVAFTTEGQSEEKLDFSNPLTLPRYRGFGQDGGNYLQGFFIGGR